MHMTDSNRASRPSSPSYPGMPPIEEAKPQIRPEASGYYACGNRFSECTRVCMYVCTCVPMYILKLSITYYNCKPRKKNAQADSVGGNESSASYKGPSSERVSENSLSWSAAMIMSASLSAWATGIVPVQLLDCFSVTNECLLLPRLLILQPMHGHLEAVRLV